MKIMKHTLVFLALFTTLLASVIISPTAYAQTTNNSNPGPMTEGIKKYKAHLFKESLVFFDRALQQDQNNNLALQYKGLVLIKQQKYADAVTHYGNLLKKYPKDIGALNNLGITLGNLDRHVDAIKTFYQVLDIKPNDVTALLGIGIAYGNLGEYADSLYYFDSALNTNPKNKISKNYQAYTKLIIDKYYPKLKNQESWTSQQSKSMKDNTKWPSILNKHLSDVAKKIAKEKRYIEFPNPSWFIKKKYLRDTEKWNLDQILQSGSDKFPYPTYTLENGTYVVHYKIHVNEIPLGISFDYKKTLDNSLAFWSNQTFSYQNKTLVFDFDYVDRSSANVLVAWVVRDFGALGHATLGKGVVEVSMGDYACDGDFQLYDLQTIEYIMRHEVGHSIGFGHSSDPKNIMYPTATPSYGYCIVTEPKS